MKKTVIFEEPLHHVCLMHGLKQTFARMPFLNKRVLEVRGKRSPFRILPLSNNSISCNMTMQIYKKRKILDSNRYIYIDNSEPSDQICRNRPLLLES